MIDVNVCGPKESLSKYIIHIVIIYSKRYEQHLLSPRKDGELTGVQECLGSCPHVRHQATYLLQCTHSEHPSNVADFNNN